MKTLLKMKRVGLPRPKGWHKKYGGIWQPSKKQGKALIKRKGKK